MKKLLSALLVTLSIPSFAAHFSFTYFGNEGGFGNQNYYACSYVEDQAHMYLEMLGATQVEVRCSGGIGPGWYTGPVNLDATYDLPVVTGAHVDILEISGDAFNPSCGLNVRILSEILKTTPYVQVLKKDDHCPFADSNYYYTLNVTR